MTDDGMTSLMNWLLPSSVNTLQTLRFLAQSSSLTRTPIELGSFKNISYFQISHNSVNMTISTGAIFSNPDNSVYIDGSHIVNVEEGAFIGNRFTKNLKKLLHIYCNFAIFKKLQLDLKKK